MAWSANTTGKSTDFSSTADVQLFAKTLNPRELAHVQVQYDPPGSPSADLIVSVYTSPAGSTASLDVSPVLAYSIDSGTDPNSASFLVSGYNIFNVTVRQTTAGSDTGDVYFQYRTDGVSA